MGRSQRPRNATPADGAPRPMPRPKPAWRESFDAWGGVPVFGSIVVVAIIVGVMIYSNRPGASVSGAAYVPHERATVKGRVAGDPKAPVKIVAYEDFQCPFCQRFTRDTEPAIVKEYLNTGKASLEFVPFAFLGPESKTAAEAAECAADQNRFWDYHDVLFLRQGAENSGAYGTSNLKKFAREVSGKFKDFDTGKFDKCVDGGEKRALIDRLAQQASAAGVNSTPTFTINGTRASGALPIDDFRKAIESALAAASK